MFTLSSTRPMPTDAIPIPILEIGGKVPSTRASITLDTSALPADLTHWAEFHNGVAAGLRIAPCTLLPHRREREEKRERERERERERDR
jgi:anaphase-promoting complex subunit 1